MITLEGIEFEGPHSDTTLLRRSSGVYVVTDHQTGGQIHLLDVGESENVRERIEDHDRKPCWSRNRRGVVGIAVHYMPYSTEESRRLVESRIRDRYHPVCGKV